MSELTLLIALRRKRIEELKVTQRLIRSRPRGTKGYAFAKAQEGPIIRELVEIQNRLRKEFKYYDNASSN